MALKTFNLNEETYKQFSEHCKKNGISMSKKVENFLKEELQKIKSPQIKNKESSFEEHPLGKYC
jgi:hypothetical protein